jgi:hypothetical protein
VDMPMPPPGAGAPPPGMPGAPPPPMPGAGTGPVAAPSPMAGNAQQGVAAVKAALEFLQKALPQIPMGSKLHTAVLKAVEQIGKELTAEGGGNDKSAMVQQLMELMRNAKTNPNAQAALPQGAPPPQAPAMPAPMPPMGA